MWLSPATSLSSGNFHCWSFGWDLMVSTSCSITHLSPLELELKEAVSCLQWVQETELGSSRRAVLTAESSPQPWGALCIGQFMFSLWKRFLEFFLYFLWFRCWKSWTRSVFSFDVLFIFILFSLFLLPFLTPIFFPWLNPCLTIVSHLILLSMMLWACLTRKSLF